MGKEAIKGWKEDLPGLYHESGVLVLSQTGSGNASYAEDSYRNDLNQGSNVKLTQESASIKECFPTSVSTGDFSGATGYFNANGGWAYATEGIKKMIEKVQDLKGLIIPGKRVDRLLQSDGKVFGIQCADESQFYAELIVLAAGDLISTFLTRADIF